MVNITSTCRELSTATVSDALDRLAIPGQAAGIYPLNDNLRMAGRAFTARYQPVDGSGGTVGDYIDDVPPGSIIVLDNAGRMSATVWGDLLTSVAHRHGVGGTVIDGICRDVDRARCLSYPLFSRGRWMRTGKDRVRLVDLNVPVVLGGVRVRPGDVVIGDGDGVVVVPVEREEHVLDAAAEIERAEDAIREEVERGARLDEARARLGYFGLQRRREG